MEIENYENHIWPHLYDEYNTHRRQKLELEFYYNEFKNLKGPFLEPACGTGMNMLELVKRGLDVYGFDISEKMLDVLIEKGKAENLDIGKKITLQNMIDFKYDFKFDAAYITARSFLHLLTQDDQINCLRNILNHLKPNGRFLTNLYTPDLELLAEYSKPNQKFEFYRTLNFKDVENVDVYTKQEHDLTNQLQTITWRFIFKDKKKNYDSKMMVRWIHRAEFELLLRQAGFKEMTLYGGFRKEPYLYENEMMWIAEK